MGIDPVAILIPALGENPACRGFVEKSVSLTDNSIHQNKAAYTIEVTILDEMINIFCIFT